MAKDKQNKRPQQPNLQDTSKVETNQFFKGMTKDPDMSVLGKENWTHAINAINNSAIGDVGVIGNEPANLLCADVPYEIIGGIHLFGDKWVLFSTDDTNSEIGIFDDSKCEYQTFINDQCLNFNRRYLVTGASKENFDCSWQVYWDDHALNPSRTLNLGPIGDDGWFTDVNVPWFSNAAIVDENGTPNIIEDEDDFPEDAENCVVYIPIEPKQLDCDRIRLSPYMDVPCITVKKSDSGGQLKNGSYQVFVAYTLNENKIGDYIAWSSIQPLFDHDDMSGSLEIRIDNLDTEFEFFELIVVFNHQMQQLAKRIGFYSTVTADGNFRDITLDFIDPKLQAIDIETLPAQNPRYERSDKMYPVNDYILRQGPYEQFDFNYQCQANAINTMWVSTQYPDTYYRDGGNKPTFMRDEQYSFFIRFVYKTGERSSSYHIPGRDPDVYPDGITVNTYYPGGDRGNNLVATYAIDANEQENWQVMNTACEVIGAPGIGNTTDDGGIIIAKGYMGYWESTERYPSRDPIRWCELCGDKIRHHKMPDENTCPSTRRSTFIPGTGQFVNVLGVEFNNITRPTYNDGTTVITNITGYEILVGSRKGAKSIIAKGLFRNMIGYNPSVEEAESGTVLQGVFPNYPFNDLSNDPFILEQDSATLSPANQTPGTWLGSGSGGFGLQTGYFNDKFTFHSPETSFNRPFLSPFEVKSYGVTDGQAVGRFKRSEDHPKHKLIRDIAAIVAAVIGAGYAIQEMRGPKTQRSKGSTALSIGQQPGAYDDRVVDIDTTGTVSQAPLNASIGGGGWFMGWSIGGGATGFGDMSYNLTDTGTDNFAAAPPDPNDPAGTSGALLDGVAPGPAANNPLATVGSAGIVPVGDTGGSTSGANAAANAQSQDQAQADVGQDQAGESLTDPFNVANIGAAITAPLATPLSWLGIAPPFGAGPQEQTMILASTPMDPLATVSGAEELYLRDMNQRHEDAIMHNETRSYMGPVREIESKESKFKGLPGLLQIMFKVHTFLNMMTTGGQEIVELVYNLMSHQDYAYKYIGYGLYHFERCNYNPLCDNYQAGVQNRAVVDNAVYISNAFQNLNANTRINNLQRPKTVVVETVGNMPDISAGGWGCADGTLCGDNSRQTIGTIGGHMNPTMGIFTGISAHYVGLKLNFENQYGQLDGILQVPSGCYEDFGTDNDQANFTSPVIYGGDCYINRYSEKVIMPFFWDFLKGEPDMYNFNYYEHQNIPNTRFWYNGDKYNLSGLIQPFTDLSFSWLSDPGNPGLPSAMHNLDRNGADAAWSSNSIGGNPLSGGFPPGGGGSIWGGGGIPAPTTGPGSAVTGPTGAGPGATPPTSMQKNGLWTIKGAMMYTHSCGINEFYVESELNMALRDWDDERGKRHFDWQEYGDLVELFHAEIIKDGNYYKYDHSLSAVNFFTQSLSFGFIQDLTYDPEVAFNCLTHYPKRVIYSLQAQKEAKKDFWRVYLPNNKRDFKNPVNVIKPISKTGALILFPHYAPQNFQGVDTLQTEGDIKITIGDAGLFNQPMQNIVNTDLSHEYGSCESMRSVINTPTGLYYISQEQGKIFSYTGSLEAISDLGMKQWFNSYLPSQLIKAFPSLEGTVDADNPVVGVGCQSVYDPNFDLVYFCKKDYAPVQESDCLELSGDFGFVINNTTCYGSDQIMSCPDDTYNLYEPGDVHPITEEILTDYLCCNYESVTNLYEDERPPTLWESQGDPIYDYSGLDMEQLFRTNLEGCIGVWFHDAQSCNPGWAACSGTTSMYRGWTHSPNAYGTSVRGPLPMDSDWQTYWMITDSKCATNLTASFSSFDSGCEYPCDQTEVSACSVSSYYDDGSFFTNVSPYDSACLIWGGGPEIEGPNPDLDWFMADSWYCSLAWANTDTDMSNCPSHPWGRWPFNNYAGLLHGTSLTTSSVTNNLVVAPWILSADLVPQISDEDQNGEDLQAGTTYEWTVCARVPRCSREPRGVNPGPNFSNICMGNRDYSNGEEMIIKLWGGNDQVATGNWMDGENENRELLDTLLINDDNSNFFGQYEWGDDDTYDRFDWVTYRGQFTPSVNMEHIMISAECPEVYANPDQFTSPKGMAMVQDLRIWGPPDVDVSTLPILGYETIDNCECPDGYDMVFADDWANGITTPATEADCIAGNVDAEEFLPPTITLIEGETQIIEAGDYQMLVENPSFEMNDWDWTYIRTNWSPYTMSINGGTQYIQISNPWDTNQDMIDAFGAWDARGIWGYTPSPWLRCQQDLSPLQNQINVAGAPYDPITGNRAMTADTQPGRWHTRGGSDVTGDLGLVVANKLDIGAISDSPSPSNVEEWEALGLYMPTWFGDMTDDMVGQSSPYDHLYMGIDNNASEGETYIGLHHQAKNLTSGETNWQEGVSQQLSIPLIAGADYSGSIYIRRNRWNVPEGDVWDTAKLILLGGMQPCCLTETLWVSESTANISEDTWVLQNIDFTAGGNWEWIQFMIQTDNEDFMIADDDYSWLYSTSELIPGATGTNFTDGATANEGAPIWNINFGNGGSTAAYMLIDNFSGFAFKRDTEVTLPDTHTCNCPEGYQQIEWPILDDDPANIVVYDDAATFEIDCLSLLGGGTFGEAGAGASNWDGDVSLTDLDWTVYCQLIPTDAPAVTCVISEETILESGGCTPPTLTDDVTPISLTDTAYFKDVSWTVSYDPKAKAWISFHDWHPDLVFPSLDHFLTTKYSMGDLTCPPGYLLNEDNMCESSQFQTELANVDYRWEPCGQFTAMGQPPLDIVFAVDTSGVCGGVSPLEQGNNNSLISSDNAPTNQWQYHLQFINEVVEILKEGMETNRVQVGVRTFGQFVGLCSQCYFLQSSSYDSHLPSWLNDLYTSEGFKRYSDDYVGITFTDDGMYSGGQLMDCYGEYNDDPYDTGMFGGCLTSALMINEGTLPENNMTGSGGGLYNQSPEDMIDENGESLWVEGAPQSCIDGSLANPDILSNSRVHDVISYSQTPGELNPDTNEPYPMTNIPFTLGTTFGGSCSGGEDGSSTWGADYTGCLTPGWSHFWSPISGTSEGIVSEDTHYVIYNGFLGGMLNGASAPYEGGYRGGYNQLLDMNRSTLGDRSAEPGYRRLLVIITNGFNGVIRGGWKKDCDLYGDSESTVTTPCQFADLDAELIVVHTNATGKCFNELNDDAKEEALSYACITEEENDISPRVFAFGMGLDFDNLSTGEWGIGLDLAQELGTTVEPTYVGTNADWESAYVGDVYIPEWTPSSEWVEYFKSSAVAMGYTEQWGQDRYDEWIVQGGGGYGSWGQAIWETGSCSNLPDVAQNFVDALGLMTYQQPSDQNQGSQVDCDCDALGDGWVQVGSNEISSPAYPPYCVNVSCDCKDFATSIGVPVDDVEIVGDCDDPVEWANFNLWDTFIDFDATSTVTWYVNPNPAMCEYTGTSIIDPTSVGGSIWRHNVRCDVYSNYYHVQYPWEIEFVESTGQMVNTVRNVEYEMEAYIYKQARDAEGELILGYSDCDSRWHDLDFNFNRAYIYNTEQVSGYLHLNLSPKNNAPLLNQYPEVVVDPNNNANSYVDILYSKEEQKYRFNQFWDITANRGEIITPTGDFDSNAAAAQQAIMWTDLNGYTRDLNSLNLEYDKPPTERKKFRHYWNKIVLKRQPEIDGDGNVILETRKMLLKLDNTKINLSIR